MNPLVEQRARRDRPLGATPPKTERSRGQILILFVMAIFVFTGMVALVIDVSWYWVNSLRVQRAADAAALAGVVQLPTNPGGAGGAYALAVAEAKKNGYDDATATVVVVPVQQPAVTGRRLEVSVTAPVDMFFMRIFGVNQIMATRTARAEFVLPVPMGSPENYYGVFGLTRGLTSTTTTTVDVITPSAGNSGFKVPTAAPATAPPAAAWAATSPTLITAVQTNNNVYAQTNINGNNQQWGTFDLLSGLAGNQVATNVNGIQVRLSDAFVTAACAGSYIQVALSWNGGVNWTTATANNRAPTAGSLTTTTSTDYTLGSAGAVTAWPFASPAHTWTGNDLGNSNFRLRLTAVKGGAPCLAATNIRVDRIEVRADFTIETTTQSTTTTTTTLPDQNLQGPGTACTGGVATCYQADGAVLNPRGFWATMNTEGAENINGDAYQAYYDDLSPLTNNSVYDATNFYNYAMEMPPGSSGGSIYVYDPVFCATANNKGTGDRWFSGAGSQVSSFYELWDTGGTLYDIGNDVLLSSSNGLFRNVDGSDTTMGGTSSGSPLPCNYATDATYGDGRDYHNQWYLLASGLTGGANGTTYRIHTTSTDPANAAAQRTVNGENSFALYASASATPRIYGIGAMQAFTPLSAAGSPVQSEFYLAQIDQVHAGKTVEIKLWDPGDTNPLNASIQILVPNAGGWSPTALDWTAAQGTTNTGAAACSALSGNNVTSITTNVGATAGTFNGCWLTIQIPIPSGYVADQSGWWKIRYTMNGSGTSNDVTTWKVAIKGNPVHLIVP